MGLGPYSETGNRFNCPSFTSATASSWWSLSDSGLILSTTSSRKSYKIPTFLESASKTTAFRDFSCDPSHFAFCYSDCSSCVISLLRLETLGMVPDWAAQLIGAIILMHQGCRFNPCSGHIQESTSELISEWNNKLQPPSLSFLSPFISL